jgi:hypothetical protein
VGQALELGLLCFFYWDECKSFIIHGIALGATPWMEIAVANARSRYETGPGCPG